MTTENLARIDADLARRVEAYLDSSVAAPTSRALVADLLAALIPEPPTDDERAGIERLAEGVIIAFVQAQARAAQDLTQHQSITTIPAVADRIMASPEWRNRHRGPITNEERELLAEARLFVETWDRKGSWSADSPIGMIARLANALEAARDAEAGR